MKNGPTAEHAAHAPSPSITVTDNMMEAGEKAMSEHFLLLCDGEQYQEIARIVYEAMEEARQEGERTIRKNT